MLVRNIGPAYSTKHLLPSLASGSLNWSLMHNSDSQPAKQNHRVLVVEDNEINQRIVRRMLEFLGCEVDVAENGAVGLEMFNQSNYAIVFMDCQMPVMDGFEATTAIRSGSRAKDVPIIAVTANVLPEDRRRCEEVGMDEFLAKPIDRPLLNRLVRSYLSMVDPKKHVA